MRSRARARKHGGATPSLLVDGLAGIEAVEIAALQEAAVVVHLDLAPLRLAIAGADLADHARLQPGRPGRRFLSDEAACSSVLRNPPTESAIHAMSSVALHLASVNDLETRQDEVLRQLEELEARIAQVLAEHGVAVPPLPGSPPVLRVMSDSAEAA